MKFLTVLMLAVSLSLFLSSRNANWTAGAAVGYEPVGQETSAEKEKDAIKQVVRQYLDITEKKDYEGLKKAFHPDAKLMSVRSNGELVQMSQEDWWTRISRIPGGAVQRSSTIALIDVTGLAAIVRVDFDRSSDYISLLKLGGEWKIVNKTLSTSLKNV